jgi:hypothetical protein
METSGFRFIGCLDIRSCLNGDINRSIFHLNNLYYCIIVNITVNVMCDKYQLIYHRATHTHTVLIIICCKCILCINKTFIKSEINVSFLLRR